MGRYGLVLKQDGAMWTHDHFKTHSDIQTFWLQKGLYKTQEISKNSFKVRAEPTKAS